MLIRPLIEAYLVVILLFLFFSLSAVSICRNIAVSFATVVRLIYCDLYVRVFAPISWSRDKRYDPPLGVPDSVAITRSSCVCVCVCVSWCVRGGVRFCVLCVCDHVD